MISIALPAIAERFWLINEGYFPAVCPICLEDITDDEGLLDPCPHTVSVHLDISGMTEGHPAWGAFGSNDEGDAEAWNSAPNGYEHLGRFNPSIMDPTHDRFLIEDEWTLVTIQQTPRRGPFGSTYTVVLAWPTSELTQPDPKEIIQRKLEQAVDYFQSSMGGLSNADDW